MTKIDIKKREERFEQIKSEMVGDAVAKSLIRPFSRMVVEFKCPDCGDIWESSIFYRMHNHRGCPKCHEKKRRQQKQRVHHLPLSQAYSVIIKKSWAYELNAGINPDDYRPSDRKTKVWWICEECGKPFVRSIQDRLVTHGKCKTCSKSSTHNKKVRCIETGEVFSSISEATRYAYKLRHPDFELSTNTKKIVGSPSSLIASCVNPRRSAYGMHWEYVK